MKRLHQQWRDMMAASYGPFWFTELTLSQQADCKRMFMGGALVMFNLWNVDEDAQAPEDVIANGIVDAQTELLDFSSKAHDDALTVAE